MKLITKRITYYDEDTARKMFDHYKRLKNLYDDEDNYIDYMCLVDEEGDIIDECSWFE